MKHSLILLVAVGVMVSCSTTQKIPRNPKFAANPVVAHRGAFKKQGFPENSIAALKEAIRLQCTGSEFDVRMTQDDSLIINHDPHYNKLDIETTSYATLLQHKLSNGEKLPTLREYINAGLQHNTRTRLVLEIKPSGQKDRGRLIAERVVKMVRELNAASMTAYISFDYDILKRIIELDPNASTQYLNGDKSPDQLKADRMSGADYHFSVFKKNPEWIAQLKKHRLILNAWTVNDAETIQWLLNEGFDFITTNEPELALQMAAKRK
jgi:glycerophosphoryl diester phosphodiesterase